MKDIEALLVLKACSLKLSEDESNEIKRYLTDEMNAGKFLYYCVHHRVVPLVWRNLEKLKITSRLESTVRRTMRSVCADVAHRNQSFYKEIQKVNHAFSQIGIKALLLKGAALAPLLYQDITLREFGDVDYLIRLEDATIIKEALLRLGYVQGSYNPDTQQVIPVKRKEEIYRQMHTHELVEFIKPNPDNPGFAFMIDLNHAIFWRTDKLSRERFQIDSEIFMNNAKSVDILGSKVYTMSPEHMLLQLCAHFYSEAVYFLWDKDWKRNKSEVCLYRFCDIREFINALPVDWKLLLDLCRLHQLEEPVYFSLASVRNILDTDVPEAFMNALHVDPRVINYFYGLDGHRLEWELSLFDRLFHPWMKYEEIQRRGMIC
ncbi:nucleotidyltransferase family protein [Paenibacillus lutimineralis]|uniref:Nucleotidyltransferase family protein n=1 Tax=Paenibacillus lutimineralis TaxID=2707005 RepID=A0A3S9V165_9BACL|nr:nucleotidyltransferase family protein [Paenibacillus lutimineralis]AZS16349.1 hypothetical protein EI981_19120 [Paenibacillus lutimineralis]